MTFSAALKYWIAASYLPLAIKLWPRAWYGAPANRPVDGVVEVRDGLGIVPLPLINETAGVIGLCAFRVKSDRLVRVCTRLVELVLGSERRFPQAEVGCSFLGIDSDRLIEILHCKVVPSLLAIGESPVRIGAGKMRVEFDRMAEVIDRVGVAPQFGVTYAARVVRCRITRIARNDFRQRSKKFPALILGPGARFRLCNMA